MNRNAKIALGCGGAGCLGLIVVVIAVAVLIVTGVIKAPGIYSPNSNSNYNSNYNRNSNFNSNANTNTNDNTNDNSTSDTSSTQSEDAQHRLYQAAGMTKDSALMMRVIRKIGLGDGTGDDHQEFIKEHFKWAMKNLAFIQSVNTPEKAIAYVEAHIDD
jgi:predicted metalloprotease